MRFGGPLLFLLVSIPFANAAEKLPRVPPGFSIEKVTTSKLVKHPMMAGFDDRGRLFVACSAGKNLRAADLMKDPPNFIKMLEDTNGDGKFDKATVFADKMTLPMGALWYRGALYVASPPHIWKLEDTNGDGVADKRTILVDRFGFSGNAASVHGCFLGPTGRIYWCDGRHGHEFVDKKGNVTSQGKAARIFSCKPDGSDVRVHCGGGMDNPVEIDFTETGEMIGSVNLFYGRPRGDCLVHWVEGGVYPRFDQQQVISEFKRTGDLLGPITNFGHVAVSGMTRYRSGAFDKVAFRSAKGRLSAEQKETKHRAERKPTYKNSIFITQFNTHKVVYSVLKRSGSTFTSTEHEFLQSDDPDFHPTDVLEDADGSLLVIDTGGWFRIGCPVSKVAKPDIYGAIYRIRKTGAHQVADPRGLKLGWEKMTAKQLVELLDDPRPAVRRKAIAQFPESRRQDSLKWKKAIDALVAVTRDRKSHSVMSRRNAIWALGQRLQRDLFLTAHSAIADCLADPDESVRIAAATSLLRSEDAIKFQFETKIIRALGDRSPAFRREVVRLLGTLKYPVGILLAPEERRALRKKRVSALCNTISAPGTDRVLEHTIIYALIQIADRKNTLPYLKDKNPTVRRAALIALDQMDGGKLTRELVTPLLDTDDPALQKTALAVIAKHGGWAKETLSLVRKWMTADAKLTPEHTAMLRGFLVAQAGDKAVGQLVADLLGSKKTNTARRLLLLEVMQRTPADRFPYLWVLALRSTLKSNDAAVKLQAVRVARQTPLPWVDELRQIARDKSATVALRAEALIALGPKAKAVDQGTLDFLTSELKKDHSPLTTLTIARAIAESPLSERQLIALAQLINSSGPLETPVLLRAFEKSKSETVGLALVKSLSGAKSAKSISAAELNRLVRTYPKSVQSAAKPLLKSLGVNPAAQQKRIAELLKLADGGDAKRGREIFYSRKAACAGCHTVAGKGGRVGPDLSAIGNIRQPRDLVEAIAFPSATLARGFRSYVIATDRGKLHSGVIARETSNEIVLRTTDLAEVRIPRNSIEQMRESSTSIMPKGFDKTLSPAELRDLLAFLRSRK